MSIDIWTEGDLFTVRIYKRLTQRPDLLWANTYELRVTPTGAGNGADAARDAAQVLGDFEQGIHLNDVSFDRGVFSTYVEDGQPYDPDTFASYSLSGLVGLRIATGDASPLQQCLKVRKAVDFGRAGRWLYRRVLSEGDITSPAGDPVLTGAFITAMNDILNRPIAGADSVFAALNDLGLDLVMAGVAGGVTRVRRVNALTADGVSTKPYNNRYFDRVASGPPIP